MAATTTGAGFSLREMSEAQDDDEFVRRRPGWQSDRDPPFSSAWVWALA